MRRTDVKSAKKTSTVKAQTGTKILIRNVPFQATAEEITELFKYVFINILKRRSKFFYLFCFFSLSFSLKYQSVRRVESGTIA